MNWFKQIFSGNHSPPERPAPVTKVENREPRRQVTIAADNPITSESDDALNRTAMAHSFADQIQAIDAGNGLVVGVLGPWGSGKTSFVNLARRNLEDACEPCYWTRTCRKRIIIGQAGITTKALREAFGEFGEWLIRTTGPHKAALKINHFFSFFLEIDQAWSRIPSYSELLHHFGAEGLRRVRLPMRWLHEEQGVEPDHQAKKIDSEKRRIKACLRSMPSASLSEKALHAYWQQLETRIEAGKTSHTSARLALRAAAALLLATDREGQRLPQQGDVDNYLQAVPGQAASVTGFTNFLNRQHATTLAPRVDVKRARKRRKETLARTLMTMARCADQGEAWREAWIVAAMEYFHDTKLTQKMLRQQTVERTTDGIQVVVGGVTYWLPLDIEC